MENFITENKDCVDEVKKYIAELNYDEGSLITILHKAQNIFGFLPKEIITIIASELKMPLASVYGVVTFYSYFTTKPKGKYNISVCTGTACFVKGAGKLKDRLIERLGINFGETTENGQISLVEARCVGACGLAPVVTVNSEVYGKVTVQKLDKILDEYLSK